TTLGVRRQQWLRTKLERRNRTLETPLGPVRVKEALRDGVVIRCKPEFDDCQRIARAEGMSLTDLNARLTSYLIQEDADA
ncbi:MAG: nickel insertion protein, partial [Puniceicoccales bacterium]